MLIVGLGNPTSQYQNTLHNLGFMALDALAKRLGKKINKAECQSLTAVKSIKGEKIILAKPYTYMNLSGIAVKSLMAKYKQSADDLIVIYDDIDLDVGRLRVRHKGSGGGHKGMNSIINVFSNEEIPRIKIGIGRPSRELPADYVTMSFTDEDWELVKPVLEKGAEAAEFWLKEGIFSTMNKYNGT